MADKPFTVTVGGVDYDVDAPDEKTAWKWANATHFKEIKNEGNVVKPPAMFTPSGERPELSYSNPSLLRGHPLVRFAEGAASPFIGAGQLAANAVGAGAPVNSFLASSEQQANEARAQLGSEGFDFWKLGGAVGSPAVLGAMKIPASATVLGRAGQGAAIGAGFGAASPVTDESDYWMKKAGQVGTGAIIGGVIPPAIDVTRKGAELTRNILDPLLPGGAERGAARILAEAAGPKRAAIEAELAKNQVLVPGANPTAPEAAARAGSPEFAALQRIASDHRPSAYSDIAQAQVAARQAAVRQVGQTPADLKDAIKARKTASDPLYGAAREAGDVVDTTPIIAKITDTLKRNPGNRELVTELMNLRKGLTDKGAPRANAEQVSSALDGLKAAIAKEDNKFIGGVLSNFKDDIANSIPGYQAAQRTFSDLSKPVNEMQVGQQLERALGKPVGEGERAGVFAQAMREGPQTIKKATGQPRFQELDEVLKPENLANVKSVLADLARKAEFERLAPLGRAKAAEAAQPFGLPATGPLNQRYMIFKTVLGRVSKGINEKTLDTMADALQVPANALKLLQKMPSEKQAHFINQLISAKLGRGAIAATSELTGESINNAR